MIDDLFTSLDRLIGEFVLGRTLVLAEVKKRSGVKSWLMWIFLE